MPLIQLSTLVLPAPFGPISAISSPGATAKEIPSRTVNPPKWRLKSSIASSAIPPPGAAVLLHVTVGAALALRLAEIELLHVGMTFQALTIAIEHDASVLHDVGMVAEFERDRSALLDQED